jgi:hypothetical protein
MKEPIEVLGCTLEIYMYIENGIIYYEFDSRLCEPPEPMVNALRVLRHIDSNDKRLVMINLQEPIGLYEKLRERFEWNVTPLEEGDVRVVFRLKG